MTTLLSALAQTHVVDLAQEWYVGMPHWPTHPPFAMGLTKSHGDYVLPGGASSAAEMIVLGTHVGTHIDGLSHFSREGRLHGDAAFAALGINTLAPIVRRGVLLDVAGAEPLAEDRLIEVADLERASRAEIRAGDAVLIRTGWGRFWNDARGYVNTQHQPGISLAAARWLAERGVFAIGADNVALERIPSPRMEVHACLLVEHGVHIIECLNLEQLRLEPATEFLFVAAPLKLRGATGSPLRPFALVEGRQSS